MKTLGVTFTKDGKADTHCDLITAKVKVVTNLLLKRQLTDKMAHYIISAVMLPQIAHGCIAHIYPEPYLAAWDGKIRAILYRTAWVARGVGRALLHSILT